MGVNLNRLKLCLTSHSWLWPSFSSALFCQGRMFARVSMCICVCTCVYLRLCVLGELHGFSKEEEVEALVNDVSPLADSGPPSSILKRLPFAPELQKSLTLCHHTHIPSSPFASTKGETIQSRAIPESFFVETQQKFIVLNEWVRLQTFCNMIKDIYKDCHQEEDMLMIYATYIVKVYSKLNLLLSLTFRAMTVFSLWPTQWKKKVCLEV